VGGWIHDKNFREWQKRTDVRRRTVRPERLEGHTATQRSSISRLNELETDCSECLLNPESLMAPFCGHSTMSPRCPCYRIIATGLPREYIDVRRVIQTGRCFKVYRFRGCIGSRLLWLLQKYLVAIECLISDPVREERPMPPVHLYILLVQIYSTRPRGMF